MLMTQDGNKVILHYRPFRLDVYSGHKDLVISLNSRNLLKYEHFREKKRQDDSSNENDGEENNSDGKSSETEKSSTEENDDEGEGFWEEEFNNYPDTKPYGSSSVGLDISFIGFDHLYGIPEHADDFALKSTQLAALNTFPPLFEHSTETGGDSWADFRGTDPYRLYNLDVFEFETRNPMSLYGAVPYVVGHSRTHTVGALWLNAAETWIDIQSSTASKGYLRALVDSFRSSSDTPQTDTHWMSESGLIDVYLFLGPRPRDVFRQYTALTGVSEIPPQFAQAYHQCRWNYRDQADVAAVNAGFDEHDIPMDVMWLDIEYTDGKRYFTWDPTTFPEPKAMIADLSARGRKLVTIIDPHIKKDDNYKIYKEAKDQDLFVKNKDGQELDGYCWPGPAAYLDFLKPDVKDYWAKYFGFDLFEGSTEDVHIWNDMNEPSVFNGPEVTMHKDAKHYGGWEHRDIHNMYGFYHHQATHKGLKDRTNGRLRPYILTRAFFAGSQRYASVWTGDNTASWEQLQISIPMMLSLSVAGIPFVGADVGGFFGNPDEELLARWYQTGAFSPFFRAHAHIDTRRREPWLFSTETKRIIRSAIRYRYRLLPYWYTVFQEHSVTGLPVLRPIWLEFPDEESLFAEEKAFMIGSAETPFTLSPPSFQFHLPYFSNPWIFGDALLVRPVLEAGVSSVEVRLPGRHGEDVWYDFQRYRKFPAGGTLYDDTPLDRIPVFMRGGTVLATRERVRRASGLMKNDPLTLFVAANAHGDFANGTIYLDDGETYEYQESGQFIKRTIQLSTTSAGDDSISSSAKLSLSSTNVKGSKGTWQTNKVTVERIHILGVEFPVGKVHLFYEDYKSLELEFEYNTHTQTVSIRKPNVLIQKDWTIHIHASAGDG